MEEREWRTEWEQRKKMKERENIEISGRVAQSQSQKGWERKERVRGVFSLFNDTKF